MAGFLGTPSQRAAQRAAARAGGSAADVRAAKAGAAPSAPTATTSQKQSKTNALNAINRLIRDSSGAERTRLISERNKISNTTASSFTAEVTTSVQRTIQTEQAKASAVIERNQEIEAARRRGEITETEAQRLRDNPEMARRTVRPLTEELQRRGVAPPTKFEEPEEREIVSIAEFKRMKAEEVQRRAVETAIRVREKGEFVGISEVPLSAFKTVEEFGRISPGILPEAKLKEEIETILTAPRAARIVPAGVPGKERPEVFVPLVRPKPEEFILIPDVAPTKFKLFEERIEAQKKRQEVFFESPGFERIEKVAGLITLGKGKPIEERGFVGRTSQALVRDIIGFPIALGGGLALAGEKIKLTGEAFALGREEVTGGFVQVKKEDIAGEFVSAGPRVIEEFKELPPSEKLATGLFIVTAPFLGGGPVRQFLAKRTARAKAVGKLTKAEIRQLEIAEAKAAKVSGVRPEVRRLRLEDVERLTPKAAKELEKILLEKKAEVIIGGTVAQRTQIRVPTRKPVDIDIFITGEPREFIRLLESRLKEAGVERVSAVRGKQITIGGQKAIEVKKISLLEANIKKVQLPFEPTRRAFVKTPEGIRVLRLGVQVKRKIVGGFGLEMERVRLKDRPDTRAILKSLARGKKASSLIKPQEQLKPFTPIKSISLKGEPSSLLTGRRGEPSIMGGDSIFRDLPSEFKELPSKPSILEQPSELGPTPKKVAPISDISKVTPREEAPSLLEHIRDIGPSILKPTETISDLTKDFPRPTPTKEKRIIRKLGFRFGEPVEAKNGFDLFIRKGEKRGDKFVKVASNLPKNRALTRGANIVDRYIEASFKLKPSGKETKFPDSPPSNLRKFRSPKRKTKLPAGTYVEKRKHRIDSLAEKQQLSFFRQKAKDRQPLLEPRFIIGKQSKRF